MELDKIMTMKRCSEKEDKFVSINNILSQTRMKNGVKQEWCLEIL